MAEKRITRREWGIAAGMALAVTLLLQVPYVLGYWTARAGTEYSGLLVNLSDVTYYVAMQLGMGGEWLYRIRFTAEPHDGAFLYTFYLALGHLARLLGMNVEPCATANPDPSEVILRARQQIADALGADIERVRISVEL